VRRSQTYEVQVFDQIPALKETYRASTARDNAPSARKLHPTELRKALLDQMGKVAHCRLHPAAEAMLELGEEEKMAWSVSRSFRSL
jgi:hypothetical protein